MKMNGDPNRDYAAEWKAWRLERGWSQEQEAQVLGLTRKSVRDIEKGKHRPKSQNREKMAELQKRYREASA